MDNQPQSGVLSDQDIQEIELYHRGMKLRGVTRTEEWEIITDTLKQYVDSAATELIRLAPGDSRVVTAHAAASALDHLYKCFIEDIQRAVEASDHVPEALLKM
jgi:hypothetical protein